VIEPANSGARSQHANHYTTEAATPHIIKVLLVTEGLETNLMEMLVSGGQILTLQLRKVIYVPTMASYEKMQIIMFLNANEECPSHL
jgi:hypothetical protein